MSFQGLSRVSETWVTRVNVTQHEQRIGDWNNIHFKMASNAEEVHWGQLIFTHDSRPPVLISKESVRLGRKEGERFKNRRVEVLNFHMMFAFGSDGSRH